MGRKNRYESHVKPYLADIAEWYQVLPEKQIAKKLGITPLSFRKYKSEHLELAEVLRTSKEILIDELKESLKQKAKGFKYTETKKIIRTVDGVKTQMIEEYERYSPPDTGAIHLLLKNLDETWRNDDHDTMKIKREEIEIKKKQAEQQQAEDGAILEALDTIKNGARNDAADTDAI